MTVRALSAHAALVPAHDNWPGTTSPTLPITVVMLAEQFDSSGTVVASCTLMQAMWQPDLRQRLQQVHPSIVIAYSDKDFMTSFKKRSELSDWKMVPETEPPMTEREVARFKGVSSPSDRRESQADPVFAVVVGWIASLFKNESSRLHRPQWCCGGRVRLPSWCRARP